MTTRLTLFTATLVQDSALSVSGIDRESNADRPFTLVDGMPVLPGRGIKGALVAMARRFFDPLPRSISENPSRRTALRRSAWEIANARPQERVSPRLRAGVGIRHKTGARAGGVLYDREVIPAGTHWSLDFRVDWSVAGDEAVEAEGILGYLLAQHWAKDRCWLGADVARGLGWCHLEELRAYRLNTDAYDQWVQSGRQALPDPLDEIPEVEPTRSWCFQTLDLNVSAGENRPDPGGPVWGLDMLAIGPHNTDSGVQATGDGTWAHPSWSSAEETTPDAISTDRAILMAGDRPLLPGSSVRGPMRHALARAYNAARKSVQDPHEVQGKVDKGDAGGRLFGTAERSSRVLIRDALAEGEWAAARLHMHAEDEFSAGSYGSAKRDAVRVLCGAFPVRIVVEGPDEASVKPLVEEIDRLVALGMLGHLPLGGHKTRGAGWCRWEPGQWKVVNVVRQREWSAPQETTRAPAVQRSMDQDEEKNTEGAEGQGATPEARLKVRTGSLDKQFPTVGELVQKAKEAFSSRHPLVAWWCDPAIDLNLETPPATFGREWPEGSNLKIDEVAFFSERAVWRAARTTAGCRWVFIEEVPEEEPQTQTVHVLFTPARLHGSRRFAAVNAGSGEVLLREWHTQDEILGFTLVTGGS